MKGYACFNAGSSSIKFAVFMERDGTLALSSRGKIDTRGPQLHLLAWSSQGERIEDRLLDARTGFAEQVGAVIAWVEGHLAPAQLCGIGHRVVHGGNRHAGPAVVTPGLLKEIAALAPLAPLHQPHNLAVIQAMARLHPGLTQVACFDTAFHLGAPRVSRQ